MLPFFVLALFTLFYASLPTATASPAGAVAPAVSQGSQPQWNTPLLFRPPELNTTNSLGQNFVIPESDLVLIINSAKRSLVVRDTLMLLIESVFSATKRLNAGPKEAADPVEVFSHKHGFAQIQVIGMHQALNSFKAAQVFAGMARYGERAGYYEANILVVQHRIGPIAQVYIR
ncbi:hypothetical protein XPA_010394 [Xanthoria parietina]